MFLIIIKRKIFFIDISIGLLTIRIIYVLNSDLQKEEFIVVEIIEIKKDIFWVGAVDWNVRNFHGYTTNRGSTYNAYLILDEKITLIDTVKAPFAQEMMERISEIVDPAKIDYLVSNHVEMDHSGAIPEAMKAMPNASIVTVMPNGLNGLKAHFGDQYHYIGIKTGESICLGKRTLSFVSTPMLHWPDNMVTYCPEEKLLFSNDAFGQHYASNKRFDDETDLSEVFQEAKKYYANILMPYHNQVKKALEAVAQLDVEMIVPSHGVIWRKHGSDIIKEYQKWCGEPNEKEVVIVFDSMYHSTEKLAREILETFSQAGKTVQLFDLKETHISDIMTSVLTAKYLCVGSPTLNNHFLPTVSGFLTYLKGLTTKNKIGLAFGSYGWGGQSISQIESALKDCGYEMPFDLYRFQFIPKKEAVQAMTDSIQQKINHS